MVGERAFYGIHFLPINLSLILLKICKTPCMHTLNAVQLSGSISCIGTRTSTLEQ